MLKSVDIVTQPAFAFNNEQTLPIEGFTVAGFCRDYDITPDGERLVMVRRDQIDGGEVTQPQIVIVQNWFEELRRLGARDTQVVVPPATTATVSRRVPRSSARDRTIEKVNEIGRRRWKKVSGYHQQARVENAFFRYKSIFGGAQDAPLESELLSVFERSTSADLADRTRSATR